MSNYGISNTGSGNVSVSGTVAMGRNTTATRHDVRPAAPAEPRAKEQVWDVGVVTVLSVETRAVLDELAKWGAHTERRTLQGTVFHEFVHESVHEPVHESVHESVHKGEGRTVRLSVTQSLLPGQHFAASAVEQLRREYAPRLVALVGIAGSIHPDVRLGDVVIAQEIVHYEPRKVTPEGVLRRGRSHAVTAGVQRAVNGFFTSHGEPWTLPGSSGHRALRGLIGSGEAVLADVRADERRYLREYNEKILAVETEGAGLAAAAHTSFGESGAAEAWLVVRGISDAADRQKSDSHHETAGRNAAYVFGALLPHLT
ncbi:hypothetical protein ABZ953_18450 [Streptomyces sp. NPDC046465]|uniref:5'-methylthioadenosine/S-adenosylhomocysteine nucleosidase family protein n=1 Tax=Streptomyces sp. NPDC046465 TaxID=3155810 RepID=UPI0033D84D7D